MLPLSKVILNFQLTLANRMINLGKYLKVTLEELEFAKILQLEFTSHWTVKALEVVTSSDG